MQGSTLTGALIAYAPTECGFATTCQIIGAKIASGYSVIVPDDFYQPDLSQYVPRSLNTYVFYQLAAPRSH